MKAGGFAAILSAILAAIPVAIPSSILAQSSPSHTHTEHVFNAGGRPAQAVTSASPTYRISLDSIGEPIAGRMLSGASFRLTGGLAAAHPPPGEVEGLQILADGQTLLWCSEPFSTTYNVYAGLLASLPGGHGTCAVAHVAATLVVDSTAPAQGTGLFYLVTGVNRLREEGTKGRDSSGAVRGNPAPCP
jgi:hypothetical protein